MTQKVKSGRVVSKVPLGYRNLSMVDDEGREIRTVVVDELRAPLITLAFKLYATGDWTVDGLAKHLARRGLTTLATTVDTTQVVGGDVDLLAEEALTHIVLAEYFSELQQKRPRSTCRVVNLVDLCLAQDRDSRQKLTHLLWREKLPARLACATSVHRHEVLVGIVEGVYRIVRE
jgi:hypothetical protein